MVETNSIEALQKIAAGLSPDQFAKFLETVSKRGVKVVKEKPQKPRDERPLDVQLGDAFSVVRNHVSKKAKEGTEGKDYLSTNYVTTPGGNSVKLPWVRLPEEKGVLGQVLRAAADFADKAGL